MGKESSNFCVTPKKQPGVLGFEHLQTAKGTVPVPILPRKETIADLPDRSDKLVTPAGNGLNNLIAVSIIAESFSEDKDVLAKIALFHKAVRPEGLHQFFFFKDATAILNEQQESIETFRSQRNRLSSAD